MNKNYWAKNAATTISNKVIEILGNKGFCNIVLTGGRSAEQLYSEWVKLDSFNSLKRVTFYFGDERCVPHQHPESNYGMVIRTLFSSGVPSECVVHPIQGDSSDVCSELLRYGKLLPNEIDIMILGVGDDGHIASIFPGNKIVADCKNDVIFVPVPKKKVGRITLTPWTISKSKSVYLLASTEVKKEQIRVAYQDKIAKNRMTPVAQLLRKVNKYKGCGEIFVV